MNTDDLKRRLQGFFADGLVTIVGSGLSCAEGLPGMGALAGRLLAEVPKSVLPTDQAAWDEVAAQLVAGTGLEAALHTVTVSTELDKAIACATADYIAEEEAKVLADCLTNGRELRFSRLLPHLSASASKQVEVVTTNYDRLIEFAAEWGDWGVDTGFVGRLWGHHKPLESKMAFVEKLVSKGKHPTLQYRNRVRLYKPHGSLNWFQSTHGPVCSALPLPGQRLLITPGAGKYRLGYEQPFDSHREGANTAVDRAQALLCIGYGFNDDHLQTHITPRLKAGVPAILLTHSMTPAAEDVVQCSANVIALAHSNNPKGTVVITQTGQEVLPDKQWWDLEHFIKEVLEP